MAGGWLIGAVCKDLRSNCAQAITQTFLWLILDTVPLVQLGEAPENSNTLHRRVAQQLPHIIFWAVSEYSLLSLWSSCNFCCCYFSKKKKKNILKELHLNCTTIFFFFLLSKHSESLMPWGRAVHFTAEGRKLRSIYSARTFGDLLGSLGSCRALPSASVCAPHTTFRCSTAVLSFCHWAAAQLGSGLASTAAEPVPASLVWHCLIKKWWGDDLSREERARAGISRFAVIPDQDSRGRLCLPVLIWKEHHILAADDYQPCLLPLLR